ncbi:MAG: UDP-3-O-(3-hydroxymyristoyl)glucosamine N-acyltransferase [Planctomycetaceae bacterium]|nr:UDP-3-O-(3-hydroxymyristoyl)glucosamine N-acyltransferase [Planctomycetaceae bacterium]
MNHTLAELAKLVGGTCTGDPSLVIRGAAPIHNAVQGDITFVSNAEKIFYLQNCQASAILVSKGINAEPFAMIHVADATKAFETIVKLFSPPQTAPQPGGISPQAVISPSAKLGKNVNIGPFAVIGNDVVAGDNVTIHPGVQIMSGCRIGDDSVIFPNAVLYENTVLGKRCIIHACAVLGAYGFGYDSSSGKHLLSAQLGNAALGDEVEVGACSTIDRGTYGPTFIGEGTKIDNLVMVAHNCRLGKHNLICASTGIAGSTTTGDYVVMAGRVGVKDHVHIGKGAVLGAMAGVIGDVPAGSRMVGIPATPEKDQMRMQVAKAKLPEMRRELKALQSAFAGLQADFVELQKRIAEE